MKRIRIKRLPLVVLSLVLAACCAVAAADSVRLNVQGFAPRTDKKDGHRAERPVVVSFQEAYPDVRLSLKENVEYKTTKKLLQALEKKEYTADVFTMDSAQVDIQAILSSGYCLDLTDNPEIASLLALMHPSIAAAAQVDGRIYGVPTGVYANRQLYYLADGWKAAGLTDADVPTSYTGLLDFLEAWVLRQQTNPIAVYVTNDFDRESLRPTSYTTWLLKKLLRGYANQCAATGQPMDFSDPTLQTLLERTKTVGAQIYALHEWEIQSDSKYTSHTLFMELSNPYEPIRNIVPDRLTDEDPLIISAGVTIACVNANRSKNAEVAQNFLAHYTAWVHDHTPDAYGILENWNNKDDIYTRDDYYAECAKGLLFMDATGPIHSMNPHTVASISSIIRRYEDMLAGNVENLSNSYDRKAIPKTEEQRQKVREDIAFFKTQEFYDERYRAALDYTEGELASYQQMAANLVFMQGTIFETMSSNITNLLTRYAEDKLTLDELVKKLNEQT